MTRADFIVLQWFPWLNAIRNFLTVSDDNVSLFIINAAVSRAIKIVNASGSQIGGQHDFADNDWRCSEPIACSNILKAKVRLNF